MIGSDNQGPSTQMRQFCVRMKLAEDVGGQFALHLVVKIEENCPFLGILCQYTSIIRRTSVKL
jgi:hypothetical protein